MSAIDCRPARRRRLLALVATAALILAACADDGDDASEGSGTTPSSEATEASAGDGGDGGDEGAELPELFADFTSDQYVDDANWLCKPELADNVCERDLDATAVAADGSTEEVAFTAAEDPPVDCFYVYPTVSGDEGTNSDLEPGEGEEIFTVLNQAARLRSSCRVFAPMYRQVTLSGIGGGATPEDRDMAYGDVEDAFRHYVANLSEGRPFVLVGHSQGAGLLRELIAEVIDDEPAVRDRLVAAHLLGTTVSVPEGEMVGGDFASVPLCEAADEAGCVVSYASFRSTAPPPDNSLFGATDVEGERAACVNPVAPGSDEAEPLEPYFPTSVPEGGLIGGVSAPADSQGTEVTTPWVTYPDFLTAQCVSAGPYTYLEITVMGDPDTPRVDDIGGDLTPQWGLHLVDANVAMGNLVDLVEAQAEAHGG